MNQGTKANKSGHRLEDKVENLILNNLEVVSRKFSKTKDHKNVLLKHVPYTNIYGSTRCRSEFLLCYNDRRIRIECKFQESAGSVDEKLPYLYMNFTQSIPETEAIIVIEGNGFKVGAKEWLRKKCLNTKVSVMSLDEFAKAVTEKLPPPPPKAIRVVNKLLSWLTGVV